jgi:hypothetical protein
MKRMMAKVLGAALSIAAPLAASPVTLLAQETPEVVESPLDRVDAIIEEYDQAMEAFYAAYEAAKDDAERNAVYQSQYPDASAYVDGLKAIVDEDPSHVAALTAIVWILQNTRVEEGLAGYLDTLLAHHVDSKKVADVCGSLAYNSSLESERFLRALMTKSGSRDNQGQAMYALSAVLGSRIGLHGTIAKLSEEDYPRYAEYYGEEVMALCKDLDTEALAKERKQLLVKVRDEYGDVKTRRGTLGASAGAELFEMERLQIGMVAPDISGPDLDGVEFKLSDYRGQVVFLDFWGDW